MDAWRRTSGMHRVRGRRGLGAVKALWETRDQLAERRDVTPGRIIPDSAIVAAAQAMPESRDRAAGTSRGSTAAGRSGTPPAGSPRSTRVAALDEHELPDPGARAPTGRRSPAPGPTATRSPPAGSRSPARRSASWPSSTSSRSRTCSRPTTSAGCSGPRRATRDPDALAAAVAAALAELGARPWQIELTGPVVTQRHPGRRQAAAAGREPPRTTRSPTDDVSTALVRALLALGDSVAPPGRQHRHRGLVDLLGQRVEVGDLDLEQRLERLGDRLLELGDVADAAAGSACS